MAVIATQLAVTRETFRLDVETVSADATGTAIVGPNGAGKTTLLLALQGLLACRGRVERPTRSAGVFSQPAFLRGSARWNVSVVLQSALAMDAGAAGQRALTALRLVGLEDAADQDARRLSAGQRQRLALARALVLEPQALLLDEPFASIDADGRCALRQVVGDYVARTGCALVLATQTLADVTALCRHVVLLERGRIVERLSAPGLTVSRHPYLRALLSEGRFMVSWAAADQDEPAYRAPGDGPRAPIRPPKPFRLERHNDRAGAVMATGSTAGTPDIGSPPDPAGRRGRVRSSQ
ncbi:MAG TPA: ATP-binding cassette domain-containing protein [bacterium]|nr:ATP-binding cassette domain-containing protein [bacterium]